MSTKTSFKRIAAVAAVALTLGGFSAVSAHAGTAVQADSISIVTPTATTTVGTAATSVVGFSAICTGAYAHNSDYSVQDNIGAWQVLVQSLPAAVTSYTAATNTVLATSSSYPYVGSPTMIQAGGSDPSAVALQCAGAGLETGYATLSFTPAAAGTYTFLVKGVFQAYASTTWTVVATAKAAISAAASSVLMAATSTTPTSTTDATAVTAAKTASTLAANIAVLARNSATADNADAATVSATVSGPGLISFTNSYSAAGRAITAASAGNSKTIYVFSDGTAGVGTVTISSGTTVLGSKSVTFYGAATKVTVKVLKAVVPVSGASVGSAAKAISISETDANGVALPQSAFGTLTLTSDTVASITSALSNVDTTTTASGCSATTPCYDLTPGATAGSANLTVADTTNTLSATAVAVRASSAVPTKVTFSTDSSSYNSGALGTLTITVADSVGIVPAGTYTVFSSAGATSTSALLTGTLPTTSVTVDGTGTATVAFNAPLADGSATISATGAATTITVAPVTFTVTSGASSAAQAAVDAANEATDAANAATDAANNAMDSADAAQQAALDAGDKADAALAAVTDLASKVADIATQISALSSLVSKIAASVAKISAKVKA